MGKAKMYGAYITYHPNNKADLRYRRKALEKQVTQKKKGRISNDRA